MIFAFSRVRATGRDFRDAHRALTTDDCAALGGAKLWGAFLGLFGIASNEFVLVASGDVQDVNDRISAVADVAESHTLLLEPTVRPTDDSPRTRAGLYVFRFFEVDHADVDEIASLSKTAWETFEGADAYEAEPQALFCQHDRSEQSGKMLLCTWYDGLNSWQTSRSPAPEARANFQRRGLLTHSTVAYATRLIQ